MYKETKKIVRKTNRINELEWEKKKKRHTTYSLFFVWRNKNNESAQINIKRNKNVRFVNEKKITRAHKLLITNYVEFLCSSSIWEEVLVKTKRDECGFDYLK